jgi:DNA-directed RNA polymerase specialized sigma subunit
MMVEEGLEIQRLEYKLLEMEDRAERCISQISDMPRGGNCSHDRMADTVASIADIKALLDIKKSDFYSKHLQDIEDDTLRTVMQLRYIGGSSWRNIAACTGLSQAAARSRHDRYIKKKNPRKRVLGSIVLE